MNTSDRSGTGPEIFGQGTNTAGRIFYIKDRIVCIDSPEGKCREEKSSIFSDNFQKRLNHCFGSAFDRTKRFQRRMGRIAARDAEREENARWDFRM